MSLLSDTHIDDYCDALKALDLKRIAAKLKDANQRDRRGGPVTIDGYPPGRGESSGGTAGFTITRDKDNTDPALRDMNVDDGDFVPATSVEMAYLAREHTMKDHHHEQTVRANRELHTAARAVEQLTGALAALDRLAGADITPDEEACCVSCARYRDAAGRPYFAERFRGDLCQWCYGIVNDAELNPKRQQPPRELVEMHARGQRIARNILEAAFTKGKKRSA